jgi:hypothetical protein
MTLAEFETAALAAQPLPQDTAPALVALWHDAAGHWDRAHETAQAVESVDGAWVHAYLHRKEGDLDNARYWYGRAGRPEAHGDLRDEWRAIVVALLGET